MTIGNTNLQKTIYGKGGSMKWTMAMYFGRNNGPIPCANLNANSNNPGRFKC